jgi:rhomboid protease GluP
MRTSRFGQGFFEIPHAAVYTLLTATLVISGLPFIQAGGPSASGELLYRYGAMYSSALARHEYWRLVAYGFLHFDFVHLTMNMLCLALWGAHLEKRIGSLYFLIVYFSAMILGAVIGDLTFAGPYLTVGASGATSGILGALLCLWILGKAGLDANFFAVNIGLNLAFAVANPKVNWRIHLGGFVMGLVACAVLDLIEKINARLLRCKFPEFVKVNLAILAARQPSCSFATGCRRQRVRQRQPWRSPMSSRAVLS